MVETPTPRTRRSPEAAKELILEAAEKRLAEGGPEAVRVQKIAGDLGLTDAAIYHHFRNREGLLDALARFGARRLRASMEELVAQQKESAGPDIATIVHLTLDTFETRGYAQLVLWLASAGKPVDRGSGMFGSLVELFEDTHAKRPGRRKPRNNGEPLEPRYLAALLIMVCAAEPLFGSISRRSVGLGGSKAASEEFRDWFAQSMAAALIDR